MKLSTEHHNMRTGDTLVIGYADIVAVYDSAPPGSDAWDVADSWLRYLQLRSDAGRLMMHGGKVSK